MSRALEYYRRAAQLGNAEAMVNLAYIYFKGDGARKNYSAAFQWYERAAELHHPEALRNLGIMCYAGQGTTQDIKKAYWWMTRAAKLRYDRAMCELADMYHHGAIYKPERAELWYRLSLNSGGDDEIKSAARQGLWELNNEKAPPLDE